MVVPQPSPSPAFERSGPQEPISPVVCAVPHAGRLYPGALLAASAVPIGVLEQLEDRYADLLIAKAVEAGAVAIVARVARAWIDLNRGEEDLDPALRDPPDSGPPRSARERSGLGLLPRRVSRRDLWRQPPSSASAAARIATIHRPYHAAIAQALAAAHRRFGHAILIDCHSMPTLGGLRPPRIVIGDGHGRSAGPGLAAALARTARACGITAAVNTPYAGAYSIACHGRPATHVHALQIEVDRALYLEHDMRTPSDGLERMQIMVAALTQTAILMTQSPCAIAAE